MAISGNLKRWGLPLAVALAFGTGIAVRQTPWGGTAAQAAATSPGYRLEANVPEAPAGTSGVLMYQGRLTTATGQPVNGAVSAIFKLYNGVGAVIYTANQVIVPVNGLFTTAIGGGADPNLTPTVLESLVSIGIAVGGDPEMTPRQFFGVIHGYAPSTAAVTGVSGDSFGVDGISDTSVGVRGHSNALIGVWGSTDNANFPAVWAVGGSSSGIALKVQQGGISVHGSGVNSATPVFVHEVNTAIMGNNVCGNAALARTVIDNPLTNGRPGAILIVTPNYGPSSGGVSPPRAPVGVYYADNAASPCGNIGKWVIFDLSAVAAPFVDNMRFNVLVVNQ